MNLSVFVKLNLIVAIYIDNFQIIKPFFAKIYIVKQIPNKRFYMLDFS